MVPNLKITISVVIPTYNRANTIVPCIESVVNQSYPVNEIIVVDDCSTDSTLPIINNLKYDVKVLQTYNHSGAQAARNVGIKSAESKWIAFLDSDDEWLPRKIEKQISALKNINYDQCTVIHGDCYKRNISSGKKTRWQLDSIEGKGVYKQLLSKSGTLFPSILTSKQALKKINFLDEKVPSYHEWDTAIQLAKYCKFIHIHEPLFIYNIHKNTISKNTNISVNGYQYIINKHKYEIIKFCGEIGLTNHLIINSITALNNNNHKLGRDILKQIPNKIFKKYILQFLSYLKIKPQYLINIKQMLSK